MVAGIIFVLMIVVFGSVVIIFSLFDANDYLTTAAFSFSLFVFFYSLALTVFYRFRYSVRDLMRTDEEEIEHR
jgi:amino acid transporter